MANSVFSGGWRSAICSSTIIVDIYFITARNSSCGKVMFSQASLCSREGVRYIMDRPYPREHTLPPRHTLQPGIPYPLLLTSGGHLWRPVKTCSIKALPPALPTVLTSSGGHRSGRYTSYWNVFLFLTL